MEYKLFGAGRSPDDGFVDQLLAFCALDDVQREAIAHWLESTSDFNTYTPALPPGILGSPLLPEQFRNTAAPILTLLQSWHRRSLQITDIERDLLLLGLNTMQIKLLIGYLQRLSSVKERAWIDECVGTNEDIGLPTLDAANIIWDARAVFGGASYYFWDGDADDTAYKKCYGLTCVAVVELMTSDSNGVKQRMAIQMNESAFKAFLRAINRADDQLSSLKALIKPISLGPQDT